MFAGAQVQLRNLVHATELNGKHAQLIHAPDAASGAGERVAVLVEGRRVSVKADCVITTLGNSVKDIRAAVESLSNSADYQLQTVASAIKHGSTADALAQSQRWAATACNDHA